MGTCDGLTQLIVRALEDHEKAVAPENRPRRECNATHLDDSTERDAALRRQQFSVVATSTNSCPVMWGSRDSLQTNEALCHCQRERFVVDATLCQNADALARARALSIDDVNQLGRTTGQSKRLRTVTPHRLVLSTIAGLGGGKIESIADLRREFNHQNDATVAYQAFYNRLAPSVGVGVAASANFGPARPRSRARWVSRRSSSGRNHRELA